MTDITHAAASAAILTHVKRGPADATRMAFERGWHQAAVAAARGAEAAEAAVYDRLFTFLMDQI